MSYGTNDAMDTYWDARGYTVSGIDATEKTRLRTIASVYVDSIGWRTAPSGFPVSLFPGTPVSAVQERQWPREGAIDAYGNEVSPASVPGAVERATYEAAYYAGTNPGALNSAVRGDQRVTREKFDVVEFEYDSSSMPLSGVSGNAPVIPAVATLLAPLLTGGSRFGITGVVA